MRIDGQVGKPILDRTNYVKVGLSGIQLIEQPERLEISTAIVGVIITYLTDGMINPMTRQRVPGAPEDKRVLYVEITYPFTKRPEQLTMIPPLDAQGRATVSVGFIVYHKSVPIITLRDLSLG